MAFQRWMTNILLIDTCAKYCRYVMCTVEHVWDEAGYDAYTASYCYYKVFGIRNITVTPNGNGDIRTKHMHKTQDVELSTLFAFGILQLRKTKKN